MYHNFVPSVNELLMGNKLKSWVDSEPVSCLPAFSFEN